MRVYSTAFEYLLALVHADLNRLERQEYWWGPIGCFAWRHQYFNQEERIALKIDAEIDAEGTNWPLLKADLFGGSVAQVKTAKAKFDRFVASCGPF